MGVVLCARGIDKDDLDFLAAHPSEAFEFITGSKPQRPFLRTLFARKAPKRAWPEPDDREDLDLDKSWEALHFCLTGSRGQTAAPAGLLLQDSRVIGSDDVGYGKPWALYPAQVKLFAETLAPLTAAHLKVRYDPQKMQREKVYLADLFLRDGAEGFDYIWQNFLALRTYLTKTSERGQGLVLWLT